MNRQDWELEFSNQLQQQLNLKPEQVHFPLSTCFHQGYSPNQAIAFLLKTHQLMPQLHILPVNPEALQETEPCRPKNVPAPILKTPH